MGSSVRASGMPEALRKIFVAAFATLPYNVVWKWEAGKIKDLPSNVRTAAWWPQQDLLGHPKLRAFVSHGGLLSLHEAAYHGAPTLVLPVFCDHDGNAAQAGKLRSPRSCLKNYSPSEHIPCIPIIFHLEPFKNAKLWLVEKLGYALVMDLASIAIGNLREGILKVASVHNNSYRMAAKKRSSLLRELPISPRKLATWWVEHVIEYKGAEHLKSSTR